MTQEQCSGICLTAADVGVMGYQGVIAYAHPDCPEHGLPVPAPPSEHFQIVFTTCPAGCTAGEISTIVYDDEGWPEDDWVVCETCHGEGYMEEMVDA